MFSPGDMHKKDEVIICSSSTHTFLPQKPVFLFAARSWGDAVQFPDKAFVVPGKHQLSTKETKTCAF